MLPSMQYYTISFFLSDFDLKVWLSGMEHV